MAEPHPIGHDDSPDWLAIARVDDAWRAGDLILLAELTADIVPTELDDPPPRHDTMAAVHVRADPIPADLATVAAWLRSVADDIQRHVDRVDHDPPA